LKKLAKPANWIWTNTEFLTKWIQVVALTVAAYWAYTRFQIGERPSLETRVDITSNLRWEDRGPAPDTCYVFFDIELRNQGKSSFDIEKVHIQAWRNDLPRPGAGVAQYINMDEFEHGQKVIDNSDPGLLAMHFAPGERAWRTFSWVFRAEPPGAYLFRIDSDAAHEGKMTHISARSWSQHICTTTEYSPIKRGTKLPARSRVPDVPAR